jgi:triphosphoribosyl-dephospho-CoA synthase
LVDGSLGLTIGQCATLACLLEATAPKPGNVHRSADFEDMSFTDFVISAVAIAPAMDAAIQRGVGRTVLDATRATRRLVQANTNLGMVLLLTPLAAVPRRQDLRSGIEQVLDRLTADDTACVYEAIRVVQPGGLGKSEEMDVADPAPDDLLLAMRAAAGRDMVARQYAEGFEQVLSLVAPWICEGCAQGWTLTDAIIHTQMRLLGQFPDSLIARKCGSEVAAQVSAKAQAVLDAGGPGDEGYHQGLADLDFWLRCDGNRRNPGTTADLIAAGLFVALRDEKVKPLLGNGLPGMSSEITSLRKNSR